MSIDFLYLDQLVPTPAGPATALARPMDATMKQTCTGTVSSLDGVNWAKDACRYCCFRPRADADCPPGHPQHWWYGTGDGSHNPYRCQPAKRFLAEGGDLDQYPEQAQRLRYCIRYDPRTPRAKETPA